MKLISARARRAPAPTSTENRAPAIFVPRSKSMMPSAGPRSQCACGVEIERRAAFRADALRRCRRCSSRPARSRAADSGIVSSPRLRRCSTVSSSTLELLDLLRSLPARLLNLRRIEPLPLRARHFVAGGVLLALQSFELGQQPPATRLERGELFELARQDRRRASADADANGLRDCRAGLRDRACCRFYLRYDVATWSDPFERPSFPPRASALASCPRRRRSRKKCWCSSTSRSFSTASRKPCSPASTTSSSSPAAARASIEDHFDVAFELESVLERRGKKEQLDEVRQSLEVGQRGVRAPGRAARPRTRRARRQESRRRRTVRGHPQRRCDRRDAAGAEADDRRVRARGRTGDRRRTRAAGGCLELRHRGDRRQRDLGPACIASPISSRSHRAKRRRRIWRSSAATSSRQTSSLRSRRRRAIARARFS